ncbi:MAG: MarR family transcriptional regulator [Nocardioides sp.]
MASTGAPRGALETPTLLALRELLSVSAHVSPAIARRLSLSHTELDALELLTEASVGPAELARHLGVTSAASSGIVDRLESRGHVVRRPHVSDGRRTQVEITSSGRAEVMTQLAPMFAALQQLDQRLTPAESATVEGYLRAATEALRRVL